VLALRTCVHTSRVAVDRRCLRLHRTSYSANSKVPNGVYTIRLYHTYVPSHSKVHLKWCCSETQANASRESEYYWKSFQWTSKITTVATGAVEKRKFTQFFSFVLFFIFKRETAVKDQAQFFRRVAQAELIYCRNASDLRTPISLRSHQGYCNDFLDLSDDFLDLSDPWFVNSIVSKPYVIGIINYQTVNNCTVQIKISSTYIVFCQLIDWIFNIYILIWLWSCDACKKIMNMLFVKFWFRKMLK